MATLVGTQVVGVVFLFSVLELASLDLSTRSWALSRDIGDGDGESVIGRKEL